MYLFGYHYLISTPWTKPLSVYTWLQLLSNSLWTKHIFPMSNSHILSIFLLQSGDYHKLSWWTPVLWRRYLRIWWISSLFFYVNFSFFIVPFVDTQLPVPKIYSIKCNIHVLDVYLPLLLLLLLPLYIEHVFLCLQNLSCAHQRAREHAPCTSQNKRN